MVMTSGSMLLFALLIAWKINLSTATQVKLQTPQIAYNRELLLPQKLEQKLEKRADTELKNGEYSSNTVGVNLDFEEMWQNILERLNTGPGKSVSFNRRPKRDVAYNRPPNFIASVHIPITLGRTTIQTITATDPDGDELYFSFSEPSDVATMTPDGIFRTTAGKTTNLEYLTQLVKLEFSVTDGKGGAAIIEPNWSVCACQNNVSECDHEKFYRRTGRIYLALCKCGEAYVGKTCQRDRNGCAIANACFPGVPCFDNPAPRTGYRCGPCPQGYDGDGKTCEESCDRPFIENGEVIAKRYSIGSVIAFRCNQGYSIHGNPRLVCQPGKKYSSPLPTCEDIDECIRSPCHSNATCMNTDGSYLCTCNEYFVGDGYSSCKPLIAYENFECAVLGNDSIQIDWQITEPWRKSDKIDQFVVSWFRYDDLEFERIDDFHNYMDSFNSYTDKLDSIASEDSVSTLRYEALSRDRSMYLIGGLKPNTKYRVAVRILHSDGEAYNPVNECIVTTDDGISSMPTDVQIVDTTANTIDMFWNKPEQPKGLIIGYLVEYLQMSSCDERNPCEMNTLQVVADQYTGKISGLTPRTTYLIQVSAVNGAGAGLTSKHVKATTKQGRGPFLQAKKTGGKGGVCFEASFVIEKEWKNDPLQQSFLVKNLKNALSTAFEKLKPNVFEIRSLIVREVDDVTQVHVFVYIKESMVTEKNSMEVWSDNIVYVIRQSSGFEPWRTFRQSTVSVSECNECSYPEANNCGEGSECIDIPGSYVCQCKAGYRKNKIENSESFTCRAEDINEATPIPTREYVPTIHLSCERARYDIVFLVDSSSSVTLPNFKHVLEALRTFVEFFRVGPYETQFSFVQYSRNMKVRFFLNTHHNKTKLMQAIKHIRYSGHGTNTGSAIQKMVDLVLTPARGYRKQNPLIVIVITDGKSADSVEEASRNLHQITTNVYSIGVSKNVNYNQLETIAGKSGRVIPFDKFGTLKQELSAQLTSTVCPTYSCKNNQDLVDVIFVLESTTQTRGDLFAEMKKFIISLVKLMNIGSTATQVAVATINRKTSIAFKFPKYKSKDRLIKAITKIPYDGIATQPYIGKALRFLAYNMLQARQGRRVGAGLAMVFLTNGDSKDDFADAVTSISDNYDAAIHTIGVGIHPKQIKLNQLSRPHGSVFISSVKSLNDASINLKEQVVREIRKSAYCPNISPPTGIVAYPVTETAALISWESPSDVKSFTVQVREEDENSQIVRQILVSGKNQLKLTGLKPGTKYIITIIARRGPNRKISSPIEFWTVPLQIDIPRQKLVPKGFEIAFKHVGDNRTQYHIQLIDSTSTEIVDEQMLNTTGKPPNYELKTFLKVPKLGKYKLVVITISGPKKSSPRIFDVHLDELTEPTNVLVISTAHDTVDIGWDTQQHVEGYIVTVTGPLDGPVIRRRLITYENHVIIPDLNPSSQYSVQIRSFIFGQKQKSNSSQPMIFSTAPKPIRSIYHKIGKNFIDVTFVGVDEADYYNLSIVYTNDDKIIDQFQIKAGDPLRGRFNVLTVGRVRYVISGVAVKDDIPSTVTEVDVKSKFLEPTTKAQIYNETTTSFMIEWLPVLNVTSYELHLSRTGETKYKVYTSEGSRITISGLEPDTPYSITIYSISSNVTSIASDVYATRTLPKQTLDVSAQVKSPSEIKVLMKVLSDVPHQYRLALKRVNSEKILRREIVRTKAKGQVLRVNFDKLKAGYIYNITIQLVQGRKLVDPLSILAAMPPPSPPQNILLSFRDKTLLDITWDKVPEAEWYKISTISGGHEVVLKRTKKIADVLDITKPIVVDRVFLYSVSNDTESTRVTNIVNRNVKVPRERTLKTDVSSVHVEITFDADRKGFVEYYITSISPLDHRNKNIRRMRLPAKSRLIKAIFRSKYLIPGKTYFVKVTSKIRGNARDDANPLQALVKLNEPPVPLVSEVEVDETTALIRVSQEYPQARYNIKVLDAVKGTETTLTKNVSLITVRGLIPGRLYHISVQSILRGVAGPYSPPLELRTIPTSIASINPVVTANSMRLFLKRGRGDADEIRISITEPLGKRPHSRSQRLAVNKPLEAFFTDLSPVTLYRITVITRSGNRRSKPYITDVTTPYALDEGVTKRTPSKGNEGASNLSEYLFTPECQKTKHMLDIIFLISSSSAVSNAEYGILKTFIHDIVQDIRIGDGYAKVSIVEFNEHAEVQMKFNDYKSRFSTKRGIRNLKRISKTGENKLSRALGFLIREILQNPSSGARKDAEKMVIIIMKNGNTDGPRANAVRMLKTGIISTVIAIGDGLHLDIMHMLSSSPDRSQRIPSYKSLNSYASSIVKDIRCIKQGKLEEGIMHKRDKCSKLGGVSCRYGV